MFRRTVVLSKERMVWTGGGMRRILKRPMEHMEYIQKAVESGVYRSNEEKERMLRERRLGQDPIKDIMRRFRQDIYRGAAVHDYPDTYMILRQNPIPRDPMVPSLRMQRRMARRAKEAGLIPVNPVEKLTEQYWHRFELMPKPGRENPHEYPNGAPLTGEEYYRRVLGVDSPPDPLWSHMGKKAAPFQHAYAAALKHYTLVRTEGLSEDEAMAKVDELLKQEKQSEYQQAAAVVAKARKEQPQTIQAIAKQHEQDKGESWRVIMKGGRKDIALQDWNERKEQPSPPPPPTKLESVFHNVLGSEPRVLEAMMRWSKRLEAVPYTQWTVGASTSLDHWIARQVLGYSEATWQTILEAKDTAYLGHAEKLLETREALFPETILHGDGSDFMDGDGDDQDFAKKIAEQPVPPGQQQQGELSLEQLLESLNALGDNTKTPDNKSKPLYKHTSDTELTQKELDERMEQIILQMQNWRTEHHKVAPFEQWPPHKQEELNDWIQNVYLPACSSPAERFQQDFDLNATRSAILAPPPSTPEESDAFWSALHNEQDAAKLLDQMIRDGPPPGCSILQGHFWELDYDQQLDQLLNLGSIRPLLDEYSKESDRRAFLTKYADILMTGVPLEYLVEDPKGSITASDIPMRLAQDMGLPRSAKETTRYRLEKKPYRGAINDLDDNDNDTEAFESGRVLFLAWNEHKANRARYEEEMFLSNRMGLTYDNPPSQEEDGYYDFFPEEKPPGFDEKHAEEKANLRRRRQKKLDAMIEAQKKKRGGGGSKSS